MGLTGIVAILVALILIGLLTGIEIAFISANKLPLELYKKNKNSALQFWSNILDNSTRFIASILLGVNIFLVLYGLLIGTALEPVWNMAVKWIPGLSKDAVSFIRLFVEAILATLIILLVEVMSKNIFIRRKNSILNSSFITGFTRFFYNLFSPVAEFMVGISEWILKNLFDVKLDKNADMYSKLDMEIFARRGVDNVVEDKAEMNKQLFENALTLGERKLRECLVPRKEIVALPANTSMEEVRQKFIETRLSKLVVYEGSIDNITGYMHQLDLFKNPTSIQEILLPIPAVPESMLATDLINKFSEEGKTIAWVIDEYGGTAGIVTMEDLLEELFGEIRDEYDDEEEFVQKQIAQNEFILSGRIELDEIESKYNLQFREGNDAETLSGYIISEYGSIPEQKQRIILDNYEYYILNVSDTRIETVKLKILR